MVREDLKKPEVIGPKRRKCQVTEELFFPSSVPGTSGFGKSLGKRLADVLVIISNSRRQVENRFFFFKKKRR